jgi:hypothetical protein
MIIQMGDLNDETYGRFGNQLFKFFFLKIVERELNCEIRYPEWLGNFAFNLPVNNNLNYSSDVIIAPPNNDYSLSELLNLIREKMKSGSSAIDLRGFFQFHTRDYANYKDLFYETFQPNKLVLDQIINKLNALNTLNNKNLISIHIRRGDYTKYINNNKFWLTSMESIFESLDNLKKTTNDDSLIYLCSDDLNYCKSELIKENINHLTSDNLFSYQDESIRLIVDFFLMAISNVNIISNSSLSFFASMLNKKSRIFLRPSPYKNILIPYDPWNSQVLLSKI